MPDEKKEEGNLPDPVMDVLKDMQERISKLPKVDEKPEAPASTVPTYADQRAALQKRLGFSDDQMAAYEESQRSIQAPLVERSGWDSINKRTHFEKYKAEIDAEVANYRSEVRTPEIMEKIYHMIVGRHAESAPPAAPAPKPGERVASSRVSGGPGYSGSEGGSSTEKEPANKSEQLSEAEAETAKKLGVDEKRFALSRNSGRDITPLKKPVDQPSATTGADLELRRMQGARR